MPLDKETKPNFKTKLMTKSAGALKFTECISGEG